MSAAGLETFNTTLPKTNRWLKELMQELALDERHKAHVALRATLHALRDRLIPFTTDLGIRARGCSRTLFRSEHVVPPPDQRRADVLAGHAARRHGAPVAIDGDLGAGDPFARRPVPRGRGAFVAAVHGRPAR